MADYCQTCGQSIKLARDPDEVAEVIDCLSLQAPFYLGLPKAGSVVERLKTTMDDCRAWQAWPCQFPDNPGKHRKLFFWALQRFKNPAAFEVYRNECIKEAISPARAPSQEARLEAVEARRKKEMAVELEEREESAVPAPPEFFEALKKLKGSFGE